MIERTKAFEIATRSVDAGTPPGGQAVRLDLEGGRELKEGWFFPYDPVRYGGMGVIVNKTSGAVLNVGFCARTWDVFLAYDEGFQFYCYDLMITGVSDERKLLLALKQLNLSGDAERCFAEPRGLHRLIQTYSPFYERELRRRLRELPCTFSAVSPLPAIESFLEARKSGAFQFELKEHNPLGA